MGGRGGVGPSGSSQGLRPQNLTYPAQAQDYFLRQWAPLMSKHKRTENDLYRGSNEMSRKRE